MEKDTVLEVKDLNVSFYTNQRCNNVLRGISFSLRKGKTLCVVGESGCGKSVTASSVMQLLPELSRIEGGSITYRYRDEEVRIDKLGKNSSQMRALRGEEIAMIFQDPMTALNPVFTVGYQISEMLRAHMRISEKEAMARSVELLKDMGVPLPDINKIASKIMEYSSRIRPFIRDTSEILWNGIDSNKKILLEGAQGSMLDIDHGTYPYVTSSNTISAGACIGSGISPSDIGEVIGIAKAYCTRVGKGYFPSEDFGDDGKMLQEKGGEFGTTTGRARRCGWFDTVACKYAMRLNGVTSLSLMKLDVLDGFDRIKVCVGYKKNGDEIKGFPYSLDGVEPIYREFSGDVITFRFNGIDADDLP